MMKLLLSLSLGLLSAAVPAHAAARATAPKRPWTVLVYWAVDNDLEKFSVPFLRRFEQGASAAAHVVVEVDHEGKRPTERIEVLPASGPVLDENKELRHSHVVERIGETNSADARTLAQFLSWGAAHFPADHYVVVLGSHGANWRGFAEDAQSDDMIPLEGVRFALDQLTATAGQKADLVVMDACRMSFLETLFALGGSARLLVGSQFDLNGFDHRAGLTRIAQMPGLTPAQLAAEYVRTYPLLYPREKNYGASLLDLDPAPIRQDVYELEAWARTFLSLSEPRRLELARQLPSTRNDLGDWGIEIRSHALRAEADTERFRHTGLSVNCPDPEDRASYAANAFGRTVPEWNRFCEWFSTHVSAHAPAR